MPGLAGEVANLIVALKLDDSGFSGRLNAAAGALRNMDSGLSQVGRGVGQVGRGLDKILTRGALAAAAGLGAVATTAISFEDAFAGVRKTVDASDEDLDKLMDTLRGMAREIPIQFEELAGIAEQAGALGIAFGAIDEFTETVALLGETTDVTTEQAATSLGVLANVLGLAEEDFDNFGSALVDLGNKGASTESQILAIAERAGAGASLIGIAADETLGWSSAAANLGIEVEAGGSALQKFFVDTLKNLQDDDTLAVMATTAGMTSDAFVQAFEEDASGALATFISGLGDLDEASRLDVLENLGFNDIRITRLLLGLAGDADMLAESLNIANTAWEENTALQTEAAKRFETTRSKLDLLIGNLRDVGYVIGNEVIPVIADLSTDFVDFLNKPGVQQNIRDFAEGLAGGIRGLVDELRGTDFSGILGGIRLTADVAKGAFDAFRSLPKEVQQLAVAALIANKVTGGAVGDLARGLGNILAGALKTIYATHVTVVGGSVTGGPGGTGGGRGGRGAGRIPFVGLGLGAAGAALALTGSENVSAEMSNRQIELTRQINEGAITSQEAARLWSEAYGQATANPFRVEVTATNGRVFGPPRPLTPGEQARMDLIADLPRRIGENDEAPTGLPNTALPVLTTIRESVDRLPDTSMLAPGINALTTNLPSINSKTSQTLQRQAEAVGAVRSLQAEVSRLATVPHVINNHINVPVNVSTSVIQNYQYRQNVIRGVQTGTAPT